MSYNGSEGPAARVRGTGLMPGLPPDGPTASGRVMHVKPYLKRTLLALLCLAIAALCALGGVRLYRLLAFTAGDYTFAVLDDGTAEIRNYRGRATSLAIPSTLKKRAVTRIGMKAFNWRFYLTDVAVPDGVVAIDEGAFAGCYGLKEVRLPKGLEEIGENAFSGCRSLGGVTLPDGVTAIGGGAFDHCSGLTSIPANPFTDCRALAEIAVSDGHPALRVEDGALYDRAEARLICCPYGRAEGRFAVPAGTRRIGDGAFLDCDRLTGVDLPEGIEALGDHAFSGCARLEAVEIPAGTTGIGNAAFSGCAGLTRVAVPDGVTEIGYLAFYDCAALESIALPASVTAIGSGAFIGCRRLTVTVEAGSYAEQYCINNGLTCIRAASGHM